MRENSDRMARRSFLGGALAAAAVGSVPARASKETPRGVTTDREMPAGGVSLREKFFGCIAGCHIGSAMGAPVEGWSYERIEREHGLLDKLLPYSALRQEGLGPRARHDRGRRRAAEADDHRHYREAGPDQRRGPAAGLGGPHESQRRRAGLGAVRRAAAGDGQDAHRGGGYRQVLRLLRPGLALAFLPSHRPDQRGRRPRGHRRYPRGRPALQHRQQPGHPVGRGHGRRDCRRHQARRDGR